MKILGLLIFGLILMPTLAFASTPTHLVFWAHQTPQIKITSHSGYTNTGFPLSINFTKTDDNSYLRLYTIFDYYNDAPNSTNWFKYCIDSCKWYYGLTAPSPSKHVEATSYTMLFPGKNVIGWGNVTGGIGAGSHTITVYAMPTNGNLTFYGQYAMLEIEEVQNP